MTESINPQNAVIPPETNNEKSLMQFKGGKKKSKQQKPKLKQSNSIELKRPTYPENGQMLLNMLIERDTKIKTFEHEIRMLKEIQRRHEKALLLSDSEETQRIITHLQLELRACKSQMKQAKDKVINSDRQLALLHDEVFKVQQDNQKLKSALQQKTGSSELTPDALEHWKVKLEQMKTNLDKKDERIKELEHYSTVLLKQRDQISEKHKREETKWLQRFDTWQKKEASMNVAMLNNDYNRLKILQKHEESVSKKKPQQLRIAPTLKNVEKHVVETLGENANTEESKEGRKDFPWEKKKSGSNNALAAPAISSSSEKISTKKKFPWEK